MLLTICTIILLIGIVLLVLVCNYDCDFFLSAGLMTIVLDIIFGYGLLGLLLPVNSKIIYHEPNSIVRDERGNTFANVTIEGKNINLTSDNGYVFVSPTNKIYVVQIKGINSYGLNTPDDNSINIEVKTEEVEKK